MDCVSTSDRPTQEMSDRFGHLVAPSYEVVESRSTKTLGRDVHEVFQSCTELVHLLDDLLGQRACYRTDQVSQDLLVVEDATSARCMYTRPRPKILGPPRKAFHSD